MGCTGVEEVVFGGAIEAIAADAFDGCTGLKSVVLGGRTITVGEGDAGILVKVIEGHGSFHHARLENVLRYTSGGGTVIDPPSSVTQETILLHTSNHVGNADGDDENAYYYNWNQPARTKDPLGRLPLAIAAERSVSWSSARSHDGAGGWLPMVLRENLAAIEDTDPVTGLSMFMLAAVGEDSDWEAVYRLLVEFPMMPLSATIREVVG